MSDPIDDAKTELLRRIFRLVGERREVISKRDDLRAIVKGYKRYVTEDDPDEVTRPFDGGMRLVEAAITAGLDDVDKLILEALELFAGPPEEDADDGEDAT